MSPPKTTEQVRASWAAFFVWCDIDGRGTYWRLAVRRQLDDGEPGIYFPVEDFDDYAENYDNCPAEPIVAPKPWDKRE